MQRFVLLLSFAVFVYSASDPQACKDGDEHCSLPDRAEQEYQKIAADYAAAKVYPWRQHVEAHSLRQVLLEYVTNTSLSGKIRALELACGNGHYSRLVVEEWKLVEELVAIDISSEMIRLAKEQNASPSIVYMVGDATMGQIVQEGNFDLVFAAYLLNYCSNWDMLLKMASTIKKNLAPGRAFITLQSSTAQDWDKFADTRTFGFEKFLATDDGKPMEDFTPIIVRTYKPRGQYEQFFEFTNYKINSTTIEAALKEAGFESVEFIHLKADQPGFELLETARPTVLVYAK